MDPFTLYKSTVLQPKIWSKKVALNLYMGQKLRSKKIKDTFFKKILTQKYEKLTFWLKMGGRLIHKIHLYTGK